MKKRTLNIAGPGAAVLAVLLLASPSAMAQTDLVNEDFQTPDLANATQLDDTALVAGWTFIQGNGNIFKMRENPASGDVTGPVGNQAVQFEWAGQYAEYDTGHNWASDDVYTLTLNATEQTWGSANDRTVGVKISETVRDGSGNLIGTELWSATALLPEYDTDHDGGDPWSPAQTFTFTLDPTDFSGGTEGSLITLEVGSEGSRGMFVDNISLMLAVPPEKFQLIITPNSPTSLFKLEWPSQAGMLYRVLNNTGLGTPIDTWSIVDEDIAATPDTNTYNVNPGDPTLFYAVEEYPAPPPPPLLEENFDAGALLPVGWTSNGPSNGTDWEVDTPSGVASGPTAANSAPNCAGTNISGYYTENADVSLVSSSIAIPSGSGATLSFRQFIDTDLAGTPHDLGSVRILDADNSDAPIAGLEILDIEGDGLAGWTAETLAMTAGQVGGKNIRVEFRFVSNAGTVPDLDVWGGFYVDDVVVTQN